MKDEDKYLDDLTKKIIKDTPLESPSFDFTNTVMSQINNLSDSMVTVYKPLISRTAWVLIGFVFLALILYVIFFSNQTETSPSGWLNTIDFSQLSNNKLSNILSSFTMSKTFTYAFVLFGVMMCVQISFIKHHFNKRLEY